MKILLINGSPKGKRSNSLRLADAFAEGIVSAVGAETETVELASMDIKGCKGCFGCWKATPGKCVIKDDMPLIIEKLIAADIVIYSFPLYYFSVPGILKDMIDRQLPMMLPFMAERDDGIGSGSHPQRYDMSGKKYVLISTCGFYSSEGNYDAVCGMFDHICGRNGYETIFCGQGELFSIDALRDRTGAYLDIVRKAGAEYAGGRISAQTKEQLSELLMEKELFETLADASWGVSKDGTEAGKPDQSYIFTKQMAALYNKSAFDGRERILEMRYTDIDKTYQIRLGRDGSEFTDERFGEPTTIIKTPFTVWADIADGKLEGTEALAKHMYTVDGDFSLMIDWGKFFGTGGSTNKAVSSDKKPPVMTTLLLPWCVFWTVLLSAGASWAFIPLIAAALTPVIMMKREQTVYDILSCASVSILSAAVMLSGNMMLPVCAGYLIFGLMWIVSCFTKEPLCAAYVKYNYGGDSALKNVIFMKTNYILAAAWGILYIIMAAVSLVLLNSGMPLLRTVIGSAAPALMGMFTVFFEKWYPRHVASGT